MQEKNGREERGENASKGTVCPRRFRGIADSQNRGDRQRQPRFLARHFGCGRGAKSRCHWACRDRVGWFCARLLRSRLHLHRKSARRRRTSRWPNFPSRGRGNARCKKGTLRAPPSPFRFCKLGICVSWAKSLCLFSTNSVSSVLRKPEIQLVARLHSLRDFTSGRKYSLPQHPQ